LGRLCPADAAVNLPDGLHSQGLRRLAPIESARGSSDDARQATCRATGQVIARRTAPGRHAHPPGRGQTAPAARHFAFITNRNDGLLLVEAEHRDHALVEQVIADLKDQALAHIPCGEFNANGAWTVLAALVHNLLRWTQLIGVPDNATRAARTLRPGCFRSPGASPATHPAGHLTSQPRWPWHGDYIAALNRILAPPTPRLN
jgi:hypothetical protein